VIGVKVRDENVIESTRMDTPDIARDPFAWSTRAVGRGVARRMRGAAPASTSKLVPSGRMKNVAFPRPVLMWWMSRWPSLQGART